MYFSGWYRHVCSLSLISVVWPVCPHSRMLGTSRRLRQSDCSAEDILWAWTPGGGHIHSGRSWPGWPGYICAGHFQWDKQAFGEVKQNNFAHSSQKEYTLLRPVKGNLGLKVPGMYWISCECGKVYVGQTGRISSIEGIVSNSRTSCYWLEQQATSEVWLHPDNFNRHTGFTLK
jgi:hypothetical protein